MNRHCLTLLLAALLCSPVCHAEVVDGQLVVRGAVTLPDGSPAAMATVAAASSSTEGRRVTTADPQGRYELRGVFDHGMHIHAASADQRHQAVLAIPSVDARLAAESPVSQQLSPAVEQRVQVVGEGGPASDVTVLVAGFGFQVQGTTNAAGAVTLRVPAQHAVDKIVAWNPNLGVGGARTVDGADISRDARIYLHPSSEHMVQVVDDQGDPVVGLELAVSFNTEATSWAVTGDLAEANVRTDAQGRARIPWAPRDGLTYVDSSPVGVDWMLFETAPPTLADATTVLRVRRRNLGSPAVGHVHLPGDLSPEGLLVIGTSSGPGNHFDSIEARVEADGSFAFHVPIDMGTGMAIADREWASDFWTGVVVPWQDADPEQVALEGYPAVPAVVKVTRGKSRRPVAQAWVHYTREVRFLYVEDGKLTTPFALVRAWFRTDRDGGAQIPFGIGSNELQVSSDDWSSEKEVSVAADHQQEPIEVKFHRP